MNNSSAHVSLSSVAQLGVMISNAFPDSRNSQGATVRAIEQVLAAFPACEAVQTVDVPYRDERRAIRQLVHDQGRPHTYMLTRIFAEQRLNLSSLDEDVRRRSCTVAATHFGEAAEAGASTVGVLSGGRPADAGQRAEALRVLEDSLAELCLAAASHGLQFAIEPLDYDSDKRATLGATTEAVGICRRLAASRHALHLCLDTAHVLLNAEDILAAAVAADPHVLEFHVCNAVTERGHPLFGDRHLPFGPPGRLDAEAIGRVLAELVRAGFLNTTKRRRVFSEVRKGAGIDSMAVVAHGFETLQKAWAYAQPLLVDMPGAHS